MAIMAAGINFGIPNTEFIVESDENGVAQSCRNVDTGIEYVGGGGGGGDFTIADVKIVISSIAEGAGIAFNLPRIENDELVYYDLSYTTGTHDYEAVLYKNNMGLDILVTSSDTPVPAIHIEVSGDAEVDDNDTYNPYVFVSGDCVLTITEA